MPYTSRPARKPTLCGCDVTAGSHQLSHHRTSSHPRGPSTSMTTPATGWKTHRLTDVEREMLFRCAATAASDPYRGLLQFRSSAARAWRMLDLRTRAVVSGLADGDEVPQLYIENLPEPQALPATPVANDGWGRKTSDTLSEFLMLVFTEALGHPISYLDQRDGEIFHDIYPTSENATAISSQSSSVGLGFHTEMFFHPEPPEYLLLHCLRSDPAGDAKTAVAAAEDIAARVSPEVRPMLGRPKYALDLARLHGRYTHNGYPITDSDPRPVIPIISDDTTYRFRFEPALMTPVNEEAAHALHAAERAAEDVAVWGAIQEGGILIVDNRRASHARTPFRANLDGSDRWLRRMMVGTGDARPGEGALIRHNLELIEPWRRMRPTVAVPYTGRVLSQ